MIVLIDTSLSDHIIVAVADSDGHIVARKKVRCQFQQSEKLLPIVDAVLRTKKIASRALRGIAVVTGPGGFTSLRVGIATANALAFAWRLPVVGIESRLSDVSEYAVQAIHTLKAQPLDTFAVPKYGREPNITVSTH